MNRCELNQSGTIFTKTTQVLGYADDVALIGMSLKTIKEASEKFQREAARMGLSINESKTKLMVLRKKTPINPPKQYVVGQYTFECVSSFKYLGSMVNDRMDEEEEIQSRIVGANRAFFALRGLLCSRLLSRGTKIKIYKAIIRPVLTYACATWTLRKIHAEKIDRFERKVLRRIVGPVRSNGAYRLRKNKEIYDLYDDLRVSHFSASNGWDTSSEWMMIGQ